MWVAVKILFSAILFLLVCAIAAMEIFGPFHLELLILAVFFLLMAGALWIRSWEKLAPALPYLGIGLSILGFVYAAGVITGNIIHVPQECSRGKSKIFCHALNAVYAIGGHIFWATLWSVASVLVFYWSWLALKQRFNRHEQT